MTYTFTTLSDFRGKNTFAHDINDNGDIVGIYGINGESFGGFVDIGGKFTTLHDPLAVGDTTDPLAVGVTFAFGINNNGDIVGFYYAVNLSEEVPEGFVDIGGKYTTLNDPFSTHGTVANGIDDYGDIVGYYYRGGTVFGFVDIGGKYTTLLPPGAKQSAAYGINENGEMIVGTYLDFKDVHHGFVTSFISVIGGFPTYTKLDDPLGTKGTFVTGINDNGDIVGYYLDSKHVKHGFVDIGGTFTTLDDPHAGHGKGEGTEALGINDSGEIVGIYIDSSGHHHGFYT